MSDPIADRLDRYIANCEQDAEEITHIADNIRSVANQMDRWVSNPGMTAEEVAHSAAGLRALADQLAEERV